MLDTSFPTGVSKAKSPRFLPGVPWPEEDPITEVHLDGKKEGYPSEDKVLSPEGL